jgi:NADP-dependent 3-hydroxy acid dehydrogenase YdfG
LSIDVLVNNAGIMPLAPFAALKVDEWEKMIDINIKGVLYDIAAALPVFIKAKSGHFISLSSVAGIKVFAPGGSMYSGTKFARARDLGRPAHGQSPCDDPFAGRYRF